MGRTPLAFASVSEILLVEVEAAVDTDSDVEPKRNTINSPDASPTFEYECIVMRIT